jgi:glycosyltransferase involved in cell wall biosynthesis
MGENSKPLVSVGMPVRNGGATLERALDSIVKQSYRSLEILISDNASEDNTQAICMAYAARDPRVRYERHAENIGIGPNFMRVLARAADPYFMWASCDDLREPDALERMMACFRKDAGLVFVGSRHDTIHFTSGATTPVAIPDIRPEFSVYENCMRLIKIAAPGLIYGVFKTSELRAVTGPAPTSLDFGDLFWLYVIATRGRMCVVPAVLLHLGVPGPEYVFKPFSRREGKRFRFSYAPYWKASCRLFLNAPGFTLGQRIALLQLLSHQVVHLILRHESDRLTPREAWRLERLRRILRRCSSLTRTW